MRRCPCRGSLNEAEAGALPGAARMGLEAPRGGRRRQPGQQRPGPGAGGPAGPPEGGGPRPGTKVSCLHTEREESRLGPEPGTDGQTEREAAGFRVETERPSQKTEPERSSLHTHPERRSHWSELETAGSWTETGTDGFSTDPRKSDLQSQPEGASLWTQPDVDGHWTELEIHGSRTQTEKAKLWANNLWTHQKRSSLRTQPEGACLSTEPSADGSWKKLYIDGSRTQQGTEGPGRKPQTDGSRLQQDAETAWKQHDTDDFSTQATDGSWTQPGTDGAQIQATHGPLTEPGIDCLLGKPSQDGPLAESELGELVAHLYSHLEFSSLTPVPRLIITPETPEPEAQPVGLPSQAEVGSGGFSSASSFDESEDDVVAGGGGASDPEDRSGVSGTHPVLKPHPLNPFSPCLFFKKFSNTYQQFISRHLFHLLTFLPMAARLLTHSGHPPNPFPLTHCLWSWGLKWMTTGRLHATQDPLKWCDRVSP